MALLLALTRSLARQNREIRQGIWTKVPLQPLRGRTLGLIGLGRIGQSVAVRAAQFRLRVIAYDPAPDLAFTQTCGIELVDLDTLLSHADYVSLHLPLSPSTNGLINRETLSRMKPRSFLVNTARGGLGGGRRLGSGAPIGPSCWCRTRCVRSGTAISGKSPADDGERSSHFAHGWSRRPVVDGHGCPSCSKHHRPSSGTVAASHRGQFRN